MNSDSGARAELPADAVATPVGAHTPGPWVISPNVYRGKEHGKYAFLEIVSSAHIFWIARVQTFDDDPGYCAANARLIAAAPEMLRVLKRVRGRMQKYRLDLDASDALDDVDAVIRKAQGIAPAGVSDQQPKESR